MARVIETTNKGNADQLGHADPALMLRVYARARPEADRAESRNYLETMAGVGASIAGQWQSAVGHLAVLGALNHDLGMKSRVHPKYKTKYRVGNWVEYDRALVQCGGITLWISEGRKRSFRVIASWKPAPTGLRGAQSKFSDYAIETALTPRLVFKLPLRQAEGFLRSLLALVDVDLQAPDHTTLSRRSQRLDLALSPPPVNQSIHLIVDSTGCPLWLRTRLAASSIGWRVSEGLNPSRFVPADNHSSGRAVAAFQSMHQCAAAVVGQPRAGDLHHRDEWRESA